MSKSFVTHFVFVVGFFVLLTIFKRWFDISYLPFWVGGLIGAFLPDVDHIIYIYLLKPQELTSQRAVRMISAGDIKNTYALLRSTTEERKKLIFHSVLFQWAFIIFAYLVISSTSNLFGMGLVLGFLVHLVVDQFIDLTHSDSLSQWFSGTTIVMDKNKSTLYWLANVVLIFFFGLVM